MIDNISLAERVRTGAHPHTTLNILVACEESQAITSAFRELGHNAFSCDLQPCRKNGHPEWHIQGDCTNLLRGTRSFTCQDGHRESVNNWHLIICHPPCTYLCKMGSVHLVRHTPDGIIINQDRWQKMIDAAKFFRTCLNAHAPYVAIENPLPMRRAGLPKPTSYLDPSWFGVKYTKKTLLWLKNLPPIMPVIEYPRPKQFVRASRGKYRSRTFPQVAQAIASQWSEFILDELSNLKNNKL